LGQLIGSPALRIKMGEIGKKIVLNKYALKDHAAYLIGVLSKMVAGSINSSFWIWGEHIGNEK